MALLTLCMLVVIVIVAIVFVSGLLRSKSVKSTNAIMRLLVNPRIDKKLPLLAANTPYTDTQQRHIVSSYVFLKSVEDTGKIDMSWLNKLRLETANDDSLKNLLIPQLIAYALVETNLQRNEELETILATYITEHPNPEENLENAISDANALTLLYSRISIHMIWYKYSEKHKLQKKLVYDTEMRDKLVASLNDKAWITKNINATTASTKIPAGHYYDAAQLEDGYVDGGVGLAQGGLNIYSLIQAIYFINVLYNYEKLKVASKLLFHRIKYNYRDTFASLAGTQLNGGRLDVRPTWLKSLAYLWGLAGKNYHIGQEYFKQLSRLPKHLHIHSFPYNYPKTDLGDSLSILRSVSEGFFRLTWGDITFEQIMNTNLNNYAAVADTNKYEFKFNLPKLRGYLNYGCDYALVFNSYTSDSADILLAGQYLSGAENDLSVPNVGALVPLKNDIYYITHYNDPEKVQAHGFVDLKQGIHEFKITSKIEVTYCVFSWASKYYVATTKINDYTWCVFDFDNVFTIQTDTTLVLTLTSTTLRNEGSFVNVTLKVAENTTARVVVSQKNDVLKIDNIPAATFGLPTGITIEPAAAVVNRLSNFVYGGKTFVVSSDVVVNNDTMPKTVVSNSVNYPLKTVSFGHYVDFVR